MSKELEALDNLLKQELIRPNKYRKTIGDIASVGQVAVIQDALERLDFIDNTKPSEALKCLTGLEKEITQRDGYITNFLKIKFDIIKQNLIKAQEQEKVLEILFKKQVDINLFITIIPFNKSIEELTRAYNQCFIERCRLTIEETTLLKRWVDGLSNDES